MRVPGELSDEHDLLAGRDWVTERVIIRRLGVRVPPLLFHCHNDFHDRGRSLSDLYRARNITETSQIFSSCRVATVSGRCRLLAARGMCSHARGPVAREIDHRSTRFPGQLGMVVLAPVMSLPTDRLPARRRTTRSAPVLPRSRAEGTRPRGSRPRVTSRGSHRGDFGAECLPLCFFLRSGRKLSGERQRNRDQ